VKKTKKANNFLEREKKFSSPAGNEVQEQNLCQKKYARCVRRGAYARGGGRDSAVELWETHGDLTTRGTQRKLERETIEKNSAKKGRKGCMRRRREGYPGAGKGV